MTAQPLARVVRGNITESVHRGHLIVLDGHGRVRAQAGDPETVTFIRSAAKAFQAMPALTSGAADRFGFTGEELALACASHSGEAAHVRLAAQMLAKAGFAEADLRCGTHPPFDEEESARMQREGEQPTQLHNNCSGKHAAMLALARHLDGDPAAYLEPSGPVQQLILEAMSLFAEVPKDKIGIAIDGCAAPNFAMPLAAMARSYLNLIAPPDGFPDDAAAAARRIVAAAMEHPELIGGTNRLDTMLMAAAPGQLFSKVGAEGVWLCGVLPSENHPSGLAIALKIEDGDDRRARPVAAVSLLKELGAIPHDAFPDLSPMPIRNRRGDQVGRVEAAAKMIADAG